MTVHSTLAGSDLHEAFHYIQSADPGAVGANKYWVDTSTDPYTLKRRDVTDTGWDVVGATTTTYAIEFVIDGGGSAITTGVKGDIEIPVAGTITGHVLLGDQAGDIVIDLWKDSYANYPPVDADSITAAAPPTLSAAAKATDTTLTGWTTAVSAGDIIRVNVDSAATVERVTMSLRLQVTE